MRPAAKCRSIAAASIGGANWSSRRYGRHSCRARCASPCTARHRRVQQGFQVDVGFGDEDDADTRSAEDGTAVDRIGLRQVLDDLGRKGRCIRCALRIRLEHGEFVAAEARDRIHAVHQPGEALRDLFQEQVADGMAQGIVDVFDADAPLGGSGPLARAPPDRRGHVGAGRNAAPPLRPGEPAQRRQRRSRSIPARSHPCPMRTPMSGSKRSATRSIVSRGLAVSGTLASCPSGLLYRGWCKDGANRVRSCAFPSSGRHHPMAPYPVRRRPEYPRRAPDGIMSPEHRNRNGLSPEIRNA